MQSPYQAVSVFAKPLIIGIGMFAIINTPVYVTPQVLNKAPNYTDLLNLTDVDKCFRISIL